MQVKGGARWGRCHTPVAKFLEFRKVIFYTLDSQPESRDAQGKKYEYCERAESQEFLYTRKESRHEKREIIRLERYKKRTPAEARVES